MAKIKHKPIKSSSETIKSGKAQKLLNLHLSFSFQYLDFNHQKFDFRGRGFEYFATLLDRLKALSSLQRQDFVQTHSKAWRIHPIDWQDVTETTFATGAAGAAIEEHDLAAWQFQLSANEHGRVHGFLIADIFYVVWLDPNHLLYAKK